MSTLSRPGTRRRLYHYVTGWLLLTGIMSFGARTCARIWFRQVQADGTYLIEMQGMATGRWQGRVRLTRPGELGEQDFRLEFDAIGVRPDADLYMSFSAGDRFEHGAYRIEQDGEPTPSPTGVVRAALMVMVGPPGVTRLSGHPVFAVDSGSLRIVRGKRGGRFGSFLLWIHQDIQQVDTVGVPWEDWPGRYKPAKLHGSFRLD